MPGTSFARLDGSGRLDCTPDVWIQYEREQPRRDPQRLQRRTRRLITLLCRLFLFRTVSLLALRRRQSGRLTPPQRRRGSTVRSVASVGPARRSRRVGRVGAGRLARRSAAIAPRSMGTRAERAGWSTPRLKTRARALAVWGVGVRIHTALSLQGTPIGVVFCLCALICLCAIFGEDLRHGHLPSLDALCWR